MIIDSGLSTTWPIDYFIKTFNCSTKVSQTQLGLSILCLKIYLVFPPKLPNIFTHCSYFTPIAPPIIPFLFCYINGNITMQE